MKKISIAFVHSKRFRKSVKLILLWGSSVIVKNYKGVVLIMIILKSSKRSTINTKTVLSIRIFIDEQNIMIPSDNRRFFCMFESQGHNDNVINW